MNNFSLSVVIFPADLWLTNVELDEHDNVVSGWVENGHWCYRSNGTTQFAYRTYDDPLSPVTHFPLVPQIKVLVPPI